MTGNNFIEKTTKTEQPTQLIQANLFSQVELSTETKINNSRFNFLEKTEEIEDVFAKIKTHKQFAFHLIKESDDSLIANIIGIGISIFNDNGYYLQFNSVSKHLLKNLFEDEKITIKGFNLKFAIKSLLVHGIQIKCKLFDVQIAYYLLQPDLRNVLDLITENYLGVFLKDEKSILGKGKAKTTFSNLKQSVITDYACERACAISNLSKILNKEMIDNGLIELFEQIETPLSKVLAKMELEGIALDILMLNDFSLDLSKKISLLSSKIYDLAGEEFNISSTKQMGEILFEKLKLSDKPKKTKSGQYATSEETLLKLKESHPIIEHILTYRGIKKLLSTYVDALPEMINSSTKRIHTTFNQSVASTGRLSSVNPNIQNIPVRTELGMKVREAFISRDKNFKLMCADYSQIELRIIASLSKDEGMLSAFNNNIDIHSATAARVYKVPLKEVSKSMRSNAKSVNFGIIYGISPFGLSQNLGISRKEAKEIIDNYFIQFPKVKEYMFFAIENARKNEYVETIMGRRRYLKEINSKNGMIRAMAERNAINTPIQGSAADIIKIAMIEVDKEIGKRNMQSKMLLQVHDELIFDMHISEKRELKSLVKEKMEGAIKLAVPLIVDIDEGANWLEAH